MKPTIDFHHIVKIDLTPILRFPAEDDGAGPFCTRRLVLTDAYGLTFEVGLFTDANDPDLLRVTVQQEGAEVTS